MSLFELLIKIIKKLTYLFAFLFVILIRILRPFILIRIGSLYSDRIGHFAGNTELYLCELDSGINKKRKCTIDIFYLNNPISNGQLTIMFRRILTIFPTWFARPVYTLNNRIPGGAIHDIGSNTNMDRDVHNLLDKYPEHLKFTDFEEKKGLKQLQMMGLPPSAKFVCLLVRDSAYLESFQPEHNWCGHNYRDVNIQNYILVSEELARRGFFVFRMGAKVKLPLKSSHPKVIDYATNGLRTDFMDIYLGAKCEFCITTSSGWDAVPGFLFRKPMVYTNFVPLGYIPTFSSKFIVISKKYFNTFDKEELSFSEIFSKNVGFFLDSSCYELEKITLIENTPEEILDVVIEMVERLQGTWHPQKIDIVLQENFRKIFPKDSISPYNNKPLHGEIRARFGANYLRNNQEWIL